MNETKTRKPQLALVPGDTSNAVPTDLAVPDPDANLTSVPEPVKAPRKTPVKRIAPRSLAELDKADPRKMTPVETTNYITACREALQQQSAKLDELDKTCQKAFEQYRNADTAYKNLKADSDARLAFAIRAAQVCYESIKLQGGSR